MPLGRAVNGDPGQRTGGAQEVGAGAGVNAGVCADQEPRRKATVGRNIQTHRSTVDVAVTLSANSV